MHCLGGKFFFFQQQFGPIIFVIIRWVFVEQQPFVDAVFVRWFFIQTVDAKPERDLFTAAVAEPVGRVTGFFRGIQFRYAARGNLGPEYPAESESVGLRHSRQPRDEFEGV